MTPDTHNSQLYALDDFLINPVECGTGKCNFIINNEQLACQLAESFDCGIIVDPNNFDLYN